jgi:hypothetical protein
VNIRESIARTLAISVIYAMIEAFFSPQNQGNVISFYHALVFLIGLVSGFDRNIYVITANAFMFSVIEDMLYWLFKQQLPYQWTSEYIVVDHIPVYYIPYSIVALFLYKKGIKNESKHSSRE